MQLLYILFCFHSEPFAYDRYVLCDTFINLYFKTHRYNKNFGKLDYICTHEGQEYAFFEMFEA